MAAGARESEGWCVRVTCDNLLLGRQRPLPLVRLVGQKIGDDAVLKAPPLLAPLRLKIADALVERRGARGQRLDLLLVGDAGRRLRARRLPPARRQRRVCPDCRVEARALSSIRGDRL